MNSRRFIPITASASTSSLFANPIGREHNSMFWHPSCRGWRVVMLSARIDAADEGTLERSVGSNIFEIVNDGLVSETVTPGAPA
jgi:hypothetical protein